MVGNTGGGIPADAAEGIGEALLGVEHGSRAADIAAGALPALVAKSTSPAVSERTIPPARAGRPPATDEAQTGERVARGKSPQGKSVPLVSDERPQGRPAIASQTPLPDSPTKSQTMPVSQEPQTAGENGELKADSPIRPQAPPDPDKPLAPQKQTPTAQADALAGSQRPSPMQALQAAAQSEPDAGRGGESETGQAQQPMQSIMSGPEAVQDAPDVVGRADISAQPASDAHSGDVVDGPGGQIRESIQSSIAEGQSQVTIRLNPPELGRVTVRFEESGGQITALVEAARAQTRAEIQQALPEILRNLQEAGVQIRRIDVAAPPEQHQNSRDLPSPQPHAQQDSSQRRQAQQERSSYAEQDGPVYPRIHAYGTHSRSDAQRLSVSGENSINMLI